jgi:hypothetical protein
MRKLGSRQTEDYNSSEGRISERQDLKGLRVALGAAAIGSLREIFVLEGCVDRIECTGIRSELRSQVEEPET